MDTTVAYMWWKVRYGFNGGGGRGGRRYILLVHDLECYLMLYGGGGDFINCFSII